MTPRFVPEGGDPCRDWLVRVEDILEACARITGYVGNLNQEKFTVVHEYFGVSIPIIWKTVQEDIPSLIPLLQEILEKNR